MPSYAALLGHHPRISLAELCAAVPGFTLEHLIAKQWAIFSSTDELSPDMINQLGGTIVIARSVSDNVLTVGDVPRIIQNELEVKRGKLVFALRCSNVPKKLIRKFYKEGKQRMKKRGRTCRYIGSERRPAFPIQLHDEDLISGKRGCELTVIVTENLDGDTDLPPPLEMQAWIGVTVGAQDVEAYTKRDIGKPVRDTKTGLLPPKLAQIMLNFGEWLVNEAQSPSLRQGYGGQAKLKAQKDVGDKKKRKKRKVLTVYDPFCGTGVIPLECLLRGWNVHASDKMEKAITGCTKNIEWIRKEESITKKQAESNVFKHDATKAFDLKDAPDVIVTETSLGPALSKRSTASDAKKNRTVIEKLETDFLKNAAETLPGVPIVLMLPFWRLKTGPLLLEKIWKSIENAGYEPVLPPGIEANSEDRVSLLYRRPDQYVGREIVLLKPKKK